MDDEFEDNYETFRALLDAFNPAEAIKRLELMQVDPAVIQRIRERHEQQTIVIRELEEPHSVVLGNRDTWYTGPSPRDKCWPAIVGHLEKAGWSASAIGSLDTASTRIVSLLSHPKEKKFSTRGLVVGYVQSGKTTNFTAVMAKAADRGYKLFIVLAGIHNGLRRQTQARLVQQLVEPNPTRWHQLTDLERDFVPTANAASFFGKSNKAHVLCVVKKNATVLRKFAEWLKSASAYLQDCPALIIDDEADQATVATKTINPRIREILDCLPKAAYVGYTATPFANLLIDPSADDLYPKHFVVNLPKPEGHFGTEVLFGRYALDGENPEEVDDGYDMIREVPDEDVECVRPLKKTDAAGFIPEITETLSDAVRYFWMVTAARRVRDTGNPHSTMLIHTSVNTAVHNSFRIPLERLRDRMKDELEIPTVLQALRDLWEAETGRVPTEDFGEAKVPFEDLLPELPGVLNDCRIVMDNSSSEDRLDYENGPVVAIAVGGNTLSRGLTLEGLSVSYFVRAVSAYDTLLQMGRWFGYRDGYADLPRIWMTAELSEWFRHLATVETEMRRDIDIYMTEDKTPQTFAVRLRTHPALRVTQAAKMKDAVKAASAYGGQRVQTRYFRTDAEWLKDNQTAAKRLVAQAAQHAARREERPGDGRYIFRDVPYDLVLDFLKRYRFHEKSQECDADLLIGYIEKRVRSAGSLRRWNIAIVGNPVKDDDTAFEFAPGVAVQRIVRARLETTETGFADIKTLMSRRDAAVDLDGDTGSLTEQEIKVERQRQLPDRGLLVLYPIDKVSSPPPREKQRRLPLDADEHVIGVGLVFPQPHGEDSAIEWISADLSGVDPDVDIEEVDFSPIEAEDVA
ncbi:Z1 domain-containing protein [Nonomuraea cavernae]|uniref:Endonuclease n=1 Tax=Nonomuraea cavernae TaxID=2045107 RepID=A0A917YRG9_9ACTN|nr:Z1 domain-containing protein [Nonomuraea cavernae]MCA2184260.1 Z1 domain-containing protein [Nonomuraea cavernae]GGO64349.1 endonuclease [Nonomuraea cavernae]